MFVIFDTYNLYLLSCLTCIYKPYIVFIIQYEILTFQNVQPQFSLTIWSITVTTIGHQIAYIAIIALKPTLCNANHSKNGCWTIYAMCSACIFWWLFFYIVCYVSIVNACTMYNVKSGGLCYFITIWIINYAKKYTFEGNYLKI